jgi:uncharacterized glyoxalase superfamily protein PhnB
MAKPIPQGFRTVTPHLVVKGCAQAIDWYKKAFGAEEIMRMPGPGGAIMHAEVRIGDSVVMMAEEFPGMSKSPKTLGGSPVTIHLYVENVDQAFERATKAGAQVLGPLTDMFWGDRYGMVSDPYGHHWSMATHKEDLSPEEIGRRGAEAMKQMGKG